MKIGEREVSLLLNEEGRQVFELAELNLTESPFVLVKVEESDDIGIWISVGR